MSLTTRFRTFLALLRIGATARRYSRGGLAVAVIIGLATSGVIACLVALTMTAISYDVRAQRDMQRQLVVDESLEQEGPAGLDKAPLQACVMGDFAGNGIQFDIVLLGHHDPSLTPPPGLDRWPAPGEAFLSPTLVATWGSPAGVTRYGRIAGTIGLDGLTAPNELLAYVAPLPGTVDESRYSAYRGFGDTVRRPWWTSEPGASFGQTTFINAAPVFVMMVLLLALLPSMTLLLVARGLVERDQARRALVLRSLGATPAKERAVQLGELAAPVATAIALTSAATAVLLIRPVTVPIVGYPLPTTWYAERWAWFALAVAGGAALSLAALGGWRPRSATDAATPAAQPHRFPRSAALASPALFLLATWLPGVLDPGRTSTWQLTYISFSAAALATLPMTVSGLLAVTLGGVERLSRSRAWPSLLLAARNTLTSPRNTTRAISSLAIGVGLLFQALFFVNAVGPATRLATDVASDATTRHMMVAEYGDGLAPAVSTRIRHDLPAEVGMIRAELVSDENTGATATHLRGTCRDLTLVGLPCQDGPAPTASATASLGLRTSVPLDTATINVTSVARWPASDSLQLLLLVDDHPLPQDRTAAVVLASSWPANGVSSPGRDRASVALADAKQGGWVGAFGAFALVLIACTVGVTVMTQFIDQARSTIPVAVVSPTRRPIAVCAVVGLFIPLVAGGLGGIALSWLLAQTPISAGVATQFGGSTALIMAAGIVAVSTVVTLAAFFAVRRAAERWLPRGAPTSG